MRCRFVLLAAAPVLASPAWATTYMTVDQARAALFPGVALVRDDRVLTDAQAAYLGVDPRGPFKPDHYRY